MKQRLAVITILVLLISALTALVLLQGCEYPDRTGIVVTPPPQSKPVWKDVSPIHNPRDPSLSQEGGDIVLDGMSQIIGFYPVPDDDRQILALDWDQEILGFYILDLDTRTVTDMGGIRLRGTQPKLEAYSWPWALLQGEDEEGNRSWVLADLSSGHAEAVWQSYAWVPLGLRRRPLWYSGETWYLGPVSGPAVTEAVTGEIAADKPKYEIINPVSQTWPRWAGGVPLSAWYMYPVQGGGSVLVNLHTGVERLFSQDQELVWDMERTMLAWVQDGELGLLEPNGRSTTLVKKNGIVPGDPLWSGNGEKLYYLGGEENYFGTTWKALWGWEEDAGVSRLFALPGSWNRWRLLVATDEAVLAAAGENGEHMVYFDVANDKTYELSNIRQWLWQEGTLVALRGGDMLRLSPGFETKVLAREAEDYTLLGLVNQFVIYSFDGRIYVKQLVM